MDTPNLVVEVFCYNTAIARKEDPKPSVATADGLDGQAAADPSAARPNRDLPIGDTPIAGIAGRLPRLAVEVP